MMSAAAIGLEALIGFNSGGSIRLVFWISLTLKDVMGLYVTFGNEVDQLNDKRN